MNRVELENQLAVVRRAVAMVVPTLLLVLGLGCTPGTLRVSNGAIAREQKAPPRCAMTQGDTSGSANAELYQQPEEILDRMKKIPQSGVPIPMKPGFVLAKIAFFWDGTVKRITFLRRDPDFHEAIISMVERWKLAEHRVNGCPVETYSVIKFLFNQRPAGVPKQTATDNLSLEIKDRTGKVFKLSDYLKPGEGNPGQQKRVLLSFMSVHCDPCQAELPVLKQYQALLKDEVQVIVIMLDDAQALPDINALLPLESTPFPVVLDGGYDLYNRFLGEMSQVGIPFNLLLDADGRTLKSAAGYKNSQEFIKRFR